MFKIIILINLVLLLSCNTSKVKILEKDLKLNMTLNVLSDSSYFSDIRSIFYTNGNYYISDYNRDNIFILNDSLHLISTVGSKGRGPGELLGASHIFVPNKDSIFILNDGKKTIELFTPPTHKSTIKCPDKVDFSSDIRFCVKKDNIYLSSYLNESSLCSFSFKGNHLKSFGEVVNYKTTKETQIKNRRHLHLYKDNIIAIPDCHPRIEIYNSNGAIVNIFNLNKLSMINKVIHHINGSKSSINSYLQFIPDSYINQNYLYLLLISIEKGGSKQCNKILQLQINTDSSITPIQILDLGSGWYGPICFNEQRILAFDKSTSTLKMFYNE